MDGDIDSLDDFAELIHRAGHAESASSDAPAFVVADVVDDEIAAQVFAELGAGDHVGAAEVITHDLDAMVASGLHNDLQGFFVGAGHHHHVGGAGLGHHLRLKVAAVHRLKVGHDWDVRESLTQGADAVEAFGQNKRRACFEPIHARSHGHRRRFEGLVDIREV